MDERLQDKIDRYILGRMSAEERKTFEEEHAKDSKLREQYNYTKIVKDTVCEHAELEQLMKEFDKDIEEERRPIVAAAIPAGRVVNYNATPKQEESTTKTHRRIWLWASGIAAILIVGLFVVNPFSALEEPELQYTSIMSGTAARDGSDLSVIDRLIVDKKYSKALAMIEDAEHKMDKVTYQDKTYKKFENYGEEEKEQMEYEKLAQQQRKDDLTWMKANALIGLGRKDEALKLLDQIRHGDGEYNVKADALYNKILR